MIKIKKLFSILFFISFFFFLYSQNPIIINKQNLPELVSLKSNDAIFKEYSYILNDNLQCIASNKEPEIIFFTHTITQSDNSIISGHESQLLAIASRLNISYDTLASLNGIENSTADLMNKTLIIPTIPGLFVKKSKGNNSLEILLTQNYLEYEDETLTNHSIYYKIDGEDYIFLLDYRFSATERAYFLDSALRLPLDRDSFWISSDFGRRKNPISGEWKDHKGIDLAAAEGTPVYAVKDGAVSFCIQNDSTFGNYIILSHDKGAMTSVYAHLSKICVNKYDNVKKGQIIGYVGQTGMATGPHLHFEIRQGGVAEDPQNKLKLK